MKLKTMLENKGVSVYQAAKDMDISYSTLNDLVIEKTDIKKQAQKCCTEFLFIWV